MIRVTDLEEVMDIMLCAIDEEESVNYVADQDTIRTLMQLICFNTDLVPDIIEFDSEEEGYYYFSLDKTDDDNITFSVYSALDYDGDFIGMRGLLLVDQDVPEYFEEEISYDEEVKPIRIVFDDEEDECDGNCENCPHHNNSDTTMITDSRDNVNGFHKEWSDEKDGVKSYYSFTFRSSDEDTVFEMLRKFN